MNKQDNLSTRFSGFFSDLKPDDDGVVRFKQMYENRSLLFEIKQGKILGDYIEVRLDMADSEDEDLSAQPLLVEYNELSEPQYRFHNKGYMPRHFYNEANLVIPALISQVQDRNEYVKSIETEDV